MTEFSMWQLLWLLLHSHLTLINWIVSCLFFYLLLCKQTINIYQGRNRRRHFPVIMMPPRFHTQLGTQNVWGLIKFWSSPSTSAFLEFAKASNQLFYEPWYTIHCSGTANHPGRISGMTTLSCSYFLNLHQIICFPLDKSAVTISVW